MGYQTVGFLVAFFIRIKHPETSGKATENNLKKRADFYNNTQELLSSLKLLTSSHHCKKPILMFQQVGHKYIARGVSKAISVLLYVGTGLAALLKLSRGLPCSYLIILFLADFNNAAKTSFLPLLWLVWEKIWVDFKKRLFLDKMAFMFVQIGQKGMVEEAHG